MKQIYLNLHIGSQEDYEHIVKYQINNNEDEWFVIHACKEPYHCDVLKYSGKPTPRDIIDEALKAIHQNILDRKVFVYCNQGASCSAIIGPISFLLDEYRNERFCYSELE